MHVQFKTIAVSTTAAALSVIPGLYATKAFFNPNPPPAVYQYSNPQPNNPNAGNGIIYTPPTYIAPTYVPGYNVAPNYWNNPYWNHPYFNHSLQPHAHYFYDQNGNMLWVNPNK